MAVSSSKLRRIFLVCLISFVVFITLKLYFDIQFGSLRPFNIFPGLRQQQFVNVSKQLVHPAYRVCKPGPPLGYPEQHKMKNCLVIGDSISYGYAPFLRDQLKDVCRVQRSPVDSRYGGARDSRYGRHCLPMFIRTTSGNSTFYDVIFFNFGFHDTIYFQGQKFVDITLSEYSSNLAFIKQELEKTGAKLVFLTTTPAPQNVTLSEDIMKYNQEAVKVMANSEVIVLDLYQTIVDRCHGNTSEHFKTCGIFKSPTTDHHFNGRGSNEIAEHLTKLFKNIFHSTSASTKLMQTIPGFSSKGIRCPGKDVVVVCPPGSSCCKMKYADSGVGCCHISNPVVCKDDNHYCNQGWECSRKCWIVRCFCHKNITVKTLA